MEVRYCSTVCDGGSTITLCAAGTYTPYTPSRTMLVDQWWECRLVVRLSLWCRSSAHYHSICCGVDALPHRDVSGYGTDRCPDTPRVLTHQWLHEVLLTYHATCWITAPGNG